MENSIIIPNSFYTADCGIGEYLKKEKLVFATGDLCDFLEKQVEVISDYEEGDPMFSRKGYDLYFVNTSVFIVTPCGKFILPEKELKTIVKDMDSVSSLIV